MIEFMRECEFLMEFVEELMSIGIGDGFLEESRCIGNGVEVGMEKSFYMLIHKLRRHYTALNDNLDSDLIMHYFLLC